MHRERRCFRSWVLHTQMPLSHPGTHERDPLDVLHDNGQQKRLREHARRICDLSILAVVHLG